MLSERETRATLEAYACLYPNRVRLGGVTVLRSGEAPLSPMLNRIVGLGLDEPPTEETLDAALEAIGADVSCYVSVGPEIASGRLTGWLAARGLEPGWGWMAFRRGLDDPARQESSFRLERVGRSTAADFAEVVTAGYDLPEGVASLAAAAPEVGWDCWLALDGDVPAAAAGIFVRNGVGYLGFAATLPEHRGMGAQSALLAARIDHARRAGCDVVVTETGELRDDRPSNSYRNILRAGFTEVAVTPNWLRPARVATQTRAMQPRAMQTP